MIYDSHPLIRHWLVVGVSYFSYDVVAMYAVFKAGTAAIAPQAGWTDFLAARPLIIVHHLVIPLIVVPFFFMVGAVRGDYLIAAFVLMEASTPFVSARRILEILGRFLQSKQGTVGLYRLLISTSGASSSFTLSIYLIHSLC